MSVGLTACLQAKDDERAPAAARAWAFANEDDRAAATPKLERLAALLQSARRVLPEESLAVEADPLATPSRCATPVEAFALAAPPAAPARGFALAAGTSCDAALTSLRSRLRAGLGTAARSDFLARVVAPSTIYCGLRVEDLAPARGLAAIGLGFTAIDLPAAARYREEMLAGSAGATVATMTRVLSGCARQNGDCGLLPSGVTGFAVEGKSEMTASLEARQVEIESAFDLAYELELVTASGTRSGALAGAVTSKIQLSGLGAGEAARAKEHVELLLEAGGGAAFAASEGERRFVSDLEVVEREDGKRFVRGDVFAGDGTPVQAPIALMLTPDLTGEGSCTAIVMEPGAALAESQREEPQGAPETAPIDAAGLAGTWDQACATGALGRFGEASSFAESLAFGTPDAAGVARFTHRLVPFTDRECFGGREAGVLELVGTYATNTSQDPTADLALDYEYAELAMTLIDAGTVDAFNAGSVCGRRDWEQNQTIRFPAGDCYFDLGDAALMGITSLRRTREFSSTRAEKPRILAFARASAFAGDAPELRAKLTSASVRRFLRR